MSMCKIYSDFQLKVEKSLETIENKGKNEMMKSAAKMIYVILIAFKSVFLWIFLHILYVV